MATGLLSDVGDAKGATTDDGAQLGLASLIIESVLLLDSSIALVFNTLLWRNGPSGLPIIPAFAGAVLGLLVVLGLAAFGIGLGIKGSRKAFGDRPPSPLAIAGVVTGGAAVILWLVVGIDLIVILSSFAG
jgi:hypothetical protein